MRNIKFLAISIMIILLLICVNPILAAADRATFQFKETDLSPGGSAAGIHVGLGGDLFIIDREDELWVVNPQTGDYQNYFGFSGIELMDIVQTETSMVWWTVSDTTFGNLNLNSNAVETWDLSSVYEDLNLSAILYDDGLLWLAPWYGPSYGLFSFNVSSHNLCLFESDFGVFASDLILHDDLLWVIDWSRDSLVSMDPNTGHLVMYRDSEWDIHTYNANLQTDGNLLWWTEDDVNGKIQSFDPATFVATTYQLSAGEQPRNLTLRDGEIWYTNTNGSIGRISSNFANKVTKTLSEVVLEKSITPVCTSLGSPETSTSGHASGTFDWADIEGNSVQSLIGLQSYILPDGAAPFGIASTMDEIWVSDPGRQKLVRMVVPEDQGEVYYMFLPLVIR